MKIGTFDVDNAIDKATTFETFAFICFFLLSPSDDELLPFLSFTFTFTMLPKLIMKERGFLFWSIMTWLALYTL